MYSKFNKRLNGVFFLSWENLKDFFSVVKKENENIYTMTIVTKLLELLFMIVCFSQVMHFLKY